MAWLAPMLVAWPAGWLVERSAALRSSTPTTIQIAGLAIAVASDEANNGSGNVDPWKRDRLLGVGADVVIPDFRDAVLLMESLTTK